MLLKSFEAGRYDEESIVVCNPVNGKQELFSDREYAIVKFLKENQNQSLLALLMPNIGIAKKTHVQQCLRVLTKLKRMQIVDYFSITGRVLTSGTETLDLAPKREKIELTSLNTLAAAAFGFAVKILSPLGVSGLLAGVVSLAAAAIALFPYGSVPAALSEGSPSYLKLFFIAYFSGSLAFSMRALVQASFLKALGRTITNPVIAVYFPMVSLSSDRRAVNLLGFKARAQLAILGMITPMFFSGVFTLLALAGFMGPVAAFAGFAACAGVALILACPLFHFDGADLIQALFFRAELEEKVATQMREIFLPRSSPGREMLFTIVLSLVWLFIWLDCMRSLWETISPRLVEDFHGASSASKVGSAGTAIFLLGIMLTPVGMSVFHHFRSRAQRKRKRVVVEKDKVKDSLTFEERISALEKIPLFTFLNDQDRMALLNEMQPAYYKHGDFLVHQGELGREFFVLVKGQAQAIYTDMKGKEILLAELSDGDAFGEIALIDDVPRTASIVSDQGCITLVLRKEGFDRFAETLGSADRVKSMIRLTSFFRRHPLFSKLNARDQAQLIDSFRFQTITAGDRIPDGDENFHVIYSGVVNVDASGGEVETSLVPDDCFGYSNPLNVSYVAVEGTGLLSVAKDKFHDLVWEKLVSKPELFV